MLKVEHERLLTQTGPGTPLGRLMRAYWIPVLRSAQLETGGPPHRFRILGEDFVAFRGHDGRVGVMDEACPHRGASMALARNEPGGLRCVYHGWKISAEGGLVEAPTHQDACAVRKLRTSSHPVHEGQGIVWSWFGEGPPPPMRPLAFTGLPDDHVLAATVVANCDWLRPLETLWDIFHAQILHNQTNRNSRRGSVYFSAKGLRLDNGISYDYPEMLVQPTPYGFSYTNVDAVKRTHFRFIAPFIQHHAIEPGPDSDRALQISVPIDDDHTLLWMIFFNRTGPLRPDGFALRGMKGVPDLNDFAAHLGPRTAANRWGQDRQAMQRGDSQTGIVADSMLATIFGEDLMAIESQGKTSRSREQLGASDKALVYGRRCMLEAIRAYEKDGVPLGRDLDLSHVEALYELQQELSPAPAAVPANEGD